MYVCYVRCTYNVNVAMIEHPKERKANSTSAEVRA